MFKKLESIPLFKDLDDNILQLLEPLFEPFSCAAGMTIFEQGQIANYLYLILDGSVEMLYKPYDGPSITVTSLENGSIFGWSAVIGNTTYTSGAICKEDCQSIRMSSQDLHGLCATEPEAASIILNLLADSVSTRWEDAQSQIQLLLNSRVTAIQGNKSQMKRTRKEKQ